MLHIQKIPELRNVAKVISSRPRNIDQLCFKMSQSSENLKFLCKEDGVAIPYRKTTGRTPGVIFIPGFLSNMTGIKATALENYCVKHGHSFVRFDNVGLGSSTADLPPMKGAMTHWYSDALTVLDKLTEGPQVVVGSSLGAISMLLLAMDRPQRIHSLVGVASAFNPDLNRVIPIEPSYLKEGSSPPPQDHTQISEIFTKELLDRLYTNSLAISQPVKLLHGMQDDVVPYQCSINLAAALRSKDVDIFLRKSADHRFSHEDDIEFLVKVVSDQLSDSSNRDEAAHL